MLLRCLLQRSAQQIAIPGAVGGILQNQHSLGIPGPYGCRQGVQKSPQLGFPQAQIFFQLLLLGNVSAHPANKLQAAPPVEKALVDPLKPPHLSFRIEQGVSPSKGRLLRSKLGYLLPHLLLLLWRQGLDPAPALPIAENLLAGLVTLHHRCIRPRQHDDIGKTNLGLMRPPPLPEDKRQEPGCPQKQPRPVAQSFLNNGLPRNDHDSLALPKFC